MRLAREPGARNGEQGKRERGAGIVVRNPEIWTYYRGFRRTYCLPKLKKVRVRERGIYKLSLKKRECEQ
jgi:hypothetical protein